MTDARQAGAPTPALERRDPTGATRAVALVLPGGRATSLDPHLERHLTTARMRPIAGMLARRGRSAGLAAWLLRYRYRGWNDQQMSPLADVRWALDQVRSAHGEVPVVLVGHSMGGRAGLRMGGQPDVRGVVALAPWLPAGEPTEQLTDRCVVIAHGTLDRVTSPRASMDYAARAAAVTARCDYVAVPFDAHSMVLRARRWNAITWSAVSAML